MSHKLTLQKFPTEQVRRALDDLPETMAAGTDPPDPSGLFVVPGHERALDPDSTIVIGDRGTGKSFWSAALNSPVTRGLIGVQLPRLHLDRLETSWGFSVSTRNEEHPSRRVLQQLLTRFAAEDIWRAVLLRQLAQRYAEGLSGPDWAAVVAWVADHPEQEERLLHRISRQLAESGRRHLVIFDALDRTGSDWKSIRELTKGLLRVCLDLKGQPGIQAKVFLRPDLWEDRTIWQFPDSSKLHHGKVHLEWRRTDLYGLLWQWLCNHGDDAEPFRLWLEGSHRLAFEPALASAVEVWPIPRALRQDEALQEAVLCDLATRYMGTNHRRGRTYTWLPNHLADAKGQVSPRSFLLALRDAQRETQSGGHATVLHWDGIKRGVQGASAVRVRELGEDYPWVQQVLEPLHGLTVPCRDEDIEQRWQDAGTVRAIEQGGANVPPRQRPGSKQDDDDERFYLPPHALDVAATDRPEQALIEALQRIGVIRRVDDERVDIPDLFRVAAKIGRRGGVRPIR